MLSRNLKLCSRVINKMYSPDLSNKLIPQSKDPLEKLWSGNQKSLAF